MSQPPSDFLGRPKRRVLGNLVPREGAAYLQGPEAGQGVEDDNQQQFHGARTSNKAFPRRTRPAILYGAMIAGVVLNVILAHVMLGWRLTKMGSTEGLPSQALEEAVKERTVLDHGEREGKFSLDPGVKPVWPWELGELVKKKGPMAFPRKDVVEEPWDSSDESSESSDSD
ncbi:hypothetical protein Emag_000119 [Eimeria magna]